MTQSGLRLAIGLLAAVAVPGSILHFSAADERLAAGMSAAPFGWPRVLVAHLVAGLPLGVLAAAAVRRIPEVAGVARGVWVALGVVVALATAVFPGVGEGLAGADVGPAAALVLRAVIGLCLVFPWCVAALGSPPEFDPPARPGVCFGLAAAAALLPCGLYTSAVIGTQTKHAAELLGRDRLVRAELVLAGLCELGSDLPVMGKPPRALREGLAKAVAQLHQLAARPLPPNPAPVDRLARSELLVRLDRLDEAAQVIEPILTDDRATIRELYGDLARNPRRQAAAMLVAAVPRALGMVAPGDPAVAAIVADVFRYLDRCQARLYLASVYRDQERWAESDALLQAVLDDWLPEVRHSPVAAAVCEPALNILVFNSRADHRPADAVRWLQTGREQLPGREAHFHFELGIQHQSMGRPEPAIRHLETAASLAPDEYGVRAREHLEQLRMHTPGCFLPRSH